MTVVALSCQEIKCYSNLPLLGIKEKKFTIRGLYISTCT